MGKMDLFFCEGCGAGFADEGLETDGGFVEESRLTDVGFVEDVGNDGSGALEGSGAGDETDEFFQEEIFFSQRQTADADDFVDEDFVTFEAVKSFGIKYLFPWQRIVIQNILDAAGLCGEDDDFTDGIFRNEGDVLETDTAFVNRAGPSLTEDAFCNETDDLETDTAFVNGGPVVSSANGVFRNDEAVLETPTAFVPPAISDQPPASSGRQIVLLPTGAGKSLCFLTPALLLPGPTLVLYPLLALMSDQKRRMDEGKMKSVVFRGGQTEEEREENFLAIKDGAKIILANPEVLQNEKLVKRLSMCNICHIAIDEAHCVWEWGSTFRPAYLTLGKIIKALNVKVVTAFTATASPLVLEKISQVLFDGNAHIVRSDGDRPNIHYNVINTYAKKKEVFRLAVTEKKPLIVFCGTRKKSEDMARQLSQFYGSDKVKFYHAGMEREEKDAVEKWFYPKEDAILCCTCAFGMGVDKKDIRTVIHLEASPTAEAYIQEAGRGGRDGSVANAILLWSPSDREKFLKFPEDSRERVLMNYAESKTCRREVLLKALGDHLTYCDGCDVCQRGGPAPYAKDGDFLLKFLSRHKKLFRRERLEAEIQNAFNEKDLPFFKKNIWEDSDIREMINQLEKENKIYACKWPWRKLYSVRKIKK